MSVRVNFSRHALRVVSNTALEQPESSLIAIFCVILATLLCLVSFLMFLAEHLCRQLWNCVAIFIAILEQFVSVNTYARLFREQKLSATASRTYHVS